MENNHRKAEPCSEILDMVTYLKARPVHESDASLLRSEGEEGNISKEVGKVYERIRYAVDNKEEHFLRRHAIRRIIRRTSLLRSNPEKVLRVLLGDLKRGGYLHTGAVTSQMMAGALQILESFVVFEESLAKNFGGKSNRYRANLLDIVAGSLEDTLYDTEKEEGVVVLCARVVLPALVYENIRLLPDDQKRRIVYVAAWRSIFAADSSLLFYKLWMLDHAGWDHLAPEEINLLAKNFPKEVSRISHFSEQKESTRLIPRLHDIAIAMTLLYDAVEEYGADIGGLLKDRELFESRIADFIATRQKKDVLQAKQRAWRAILYIAITKTMLAVVVESIYVLILGNVLNVFAIVLNVFAHPILLFFITSGISNPRKRNTERAVQLASAITYGESIGSIVVHKERSGIVADIALGLYFVLLSGSVLGMTALLGTIGLHPLDIGIFFIFLVLVLYFGFRIRFRAYHMRFSGANEGFFRSTFEMLLLPLISLGRYATMKFERVNVIVFFFDFVVEAPLRLVLRFLDSFSSLMKEKREEMFSQ